MNFSAIDHTLQGLGWIRDGRGPATADTIPGEVELAGWTHLGGYPVITYTFHPAALFRMLDVASVAPQGRAAIAASLPLIDAAEIEAMLAEPNARVRLRAVLAVRELERIELAGHMLAMQADPDPAVSASAAEAAETLSRVAAAKLQAMATLELIHGVAEPLIRALCGPDGADVARSMRPICDDLLRLFRPELGQVIEARAAAFGNPPPTVPSELAGAEITISAGPAGMFRTDNELSRGFPREYRDIAGWMDVHRVWLRWELRGPTPGRESLGCDGLVWVQDHWVWCPKPWLFARNLLQVYRADSQVVQ